MTADHPAVTHGICSLQEIPLSTGEGSLELDAGMRLWSWDDLATTKYFY